MKNCKFFLNFSVNKLCGKLNDLKKFKVTREFLELFPEAYLTLSRQSSLRFRNESIDLFCNVKLTIGIY